MAQTPRSAEHAPPGTVYADLARAFRLAALFWTAVIVALAAWNASQSYQATLQGARYSARESIHKDVLYRRWATQHGGVYAPISPSTPPNPDLADVPERDIVTPSGRALTLINPAYMTRQVLELANLENASKGHITSLIPLRTANAADPWERQSLQAFEQGAPESMALQDMGGQPYFRLMRPLVTEQACLRCHAKQGYRVGDVRGGISASIPWEPYRSSMQTQILGNVAGYAVVWLIGLAGLAYGKRRLSTDLGKRLRVMADLQASNAKLAQSQGQLIQSEKMAAVGQLAAGVAHEINNPVGFVRSNLGTLKDYVQGLQALILRYEQIPLPPEQAAQLARAREELDIQNIQDDVGTLLAESKEGLDRVKGIVQNLRDFSRVDQAEWEEADLLQGLDSTLNVARNAVKYKAEVVKEYSPLPRLRCHPAQLNQVFLNLILNAVQAIDDKGTITLRSGVQGDWVWVEVGDTGHGIPPENLHRVFEPFFTTKPVGQGTGLGLALSYDIVKRHGGRIEAHSLPGQGSQFRVWLPVQGPTLEPAGVPAPGV